MRTDKRDRMQTNNINKQRMRPSDVRTAQHTHENARVRALILHTGRTHGADSPALAPGLANARKQN